MGWFLGEKGVLRRALLSTKRFAERAKSQSLGLVGQLSIGKNFLALSEDTSIHVVDVSRETLGTQSILKMPFTMSNTLNLPEDRTPSVLNRESIWRSVKKTHSQYVDGKNKELMTDTDIEDQLESLSDEVIFFSCIENKF